MMAGILIIAALWAWESAPDLASDMQTGRPQAAIWAARSAALAAAAPAQTILLYFVVGGIYPRRAWTMRAIVFRHRLCARVHERNHFGHAAR